MAMLLAKAVKNKKRENEVERAYEAGLPPPALEPGRIRERIGRRRGENLYSDETMPAHGLGESGRSLLQSVFDDGKPKEKGITLKCIKDHTVNETDPRFKNFNIISVPKDCIVTLEEENLRPPMQDYIKVNFNGKSGFVSKFVFSIV